MTTNTGYGSSKTASRPPVAPPPTQAGKPFGATRAPSHEQIAARAKAIWQARGCPSGMDEQNWREAEAQLRAELRIA
jgi:hypothetical protein